jgi:hypothetical protein
LVAEPFEVRLVAVEVAVEVDVDVAGNAVVSFGDVDYEQMDFDSAFQFE